MAIANTQVKQANRPQVSLTGRKTIFHFPLPIFHFPTVSPIYIFLWVLCTKFSTNRYNFAVYKTFPMAACCCCCFLTPLLPPADCSLWGSCLPKTSVPFSFPLSLSCLSGLLLFSIILFAFELKISIWAL